MKTVKLHIKNYDGEKTVKLEEETSIGRTSAAQIVLGDTGLSRLNTTFFRDEDLIFVVDENSTNGTFVNGERIRSGTPRQIFDGDSIKIGSETTLRVEIGEKRANTQSGVLNSESKPETNTPAVGHQPPVPPRPQPAISNSPSEKSPILLFVAVGSMLLIAFLGIAAFVILSRYEEIASNSNGIATTKISASIAIPIRVVDPLGAGDIENLDDLIEAWEVQDAAFDAKDLTAVAVSTDAPQLAVSVADWEKARAKAMERRNAPTGLVSISIPPELQGSIGKQLAEFQRMGITRATLPKDFVSLAEKRMNNELIELPLATEIYYLDNIGTSADSSPFNIFDINTNGKSPLPLNSEGFSILQKLASNYNGQKYDLSQPSDRIQMKRRLLRMFHPDAKPVLEEIAGAYHAKFKRPLKITSLTRSLEYQVDLSRATSNAYRGATPPHSTGRTFDIAYMHMTAEEQNFIMAKFAELERAGKVDALHERGQTPCIHTFVFPKK